MIRVDVWERASGPLPVAPEHPGLNRCPGKMRFQPHPNLRWPEAQFLLVFF